MADISTAVATLGLGGLGTWLGTFATQWLRSRGDRAAATATAQVTLGGQTNQLMFDVLAAARTEIATLNHRLEAQAPLLNVGAHLQEAMDHISALLASGTPEERRAAERRATAFLKRMSRLAEAEGTMRNEVQIQHSADRVPSDMRDQLDRMDGPA